MKKLFVYLSSYKKECVLAPLFKLLEVVFELLIPLIVTSVIDHGILTGDQGHILRMTLLMAALAIIGLSNTLVAQWFAARAATGFAARLRHAVLARLQGLSYVDLDRLGTSTMITRMTGDINQLQNGINMGLRLLLRSPFVVFGAMLMGSLVDPGSMLIFLGVIALLFIIVFGIIFVTMPMHKKVQGNLDKVTLATRENLNGIRVIRAFRMEESQTEAFSRLNRVLSASQVAVGRLTVLMNPLTYFVINTGILLLMRYGALRVDGGALTQGQVVALYNYMGQILVELIKFANLMVTLTKAAACGNRVADILELTSSMRDGAATPSIRDGRVTFDHVSLRYHEGSDDALTDISFEAGPGETIGIIGGTGSGKSSLVSMIPRFYDAASGTVSVDGTDVRDFSLKELRGRVAIVPQSPMLFAGTIRSNLQWGNPGATDTEMMEALRLARAEDILADREKGLDEPVEQGGRNFSGGQRQRLTIARALLRRPEILILDDSASALDYATDAALRKNLASLHPAPTLFIVSQRTASVRNANRILVMEDGLLIASGTHAELMESCPVYREIHLSQFGGKEDQRNVR